MEIRIGRQSVELPNQDGYHETQLGPIEVEILEQEAGIVRKIALEGEVMRGTPLKNRHKRDPRKVVSLNPEGRGAQTLSKRETVYINLYPMNAEERDFYSRLEMFDNGGY